MSEAALQPETHALALPLCAGTERPLHPGTERQDVQMQPLWQLLKRPPEGAPQTPLYRNAKIILQPRIGMQKLWDFGRVDDVIDAGDMHVWLVFALSQGLLQGIAVLKCNHAALKQL